MGWASKHEDDKEAMEQGFEKQKDDAEKASDSGSESDTGADESGDE